MTNAWCRLIPASDSRRCPLGEPAVQKCRPSRTAVPRHRPKFAHGPMHCCVALLSLQRLGSLGSVSHSSICDPQADRLLQKGVAAMLGFPKTIELEAEDWHRAGYFCRITLASPRDWSMDILDDHRWTHIAHVEAKHDEDTPSNELLAAVRDWAERCVSNRCACPSCEASRGCWRHAPDGRPPAANGQVA